jgi:hypothetical protein
MQLEASNLVVDEDPAGGDAEVGVVVLDAVIRTDAGRFRRTVELPYRRDAGFGSYRIDLWAPGAGPDSPIEFTSPAPVDGTDVEYGTLLETERLAPVEAIVPSWADRAVLAVDGEVVQQLDSAGDAGTDSAGQASAGGAAAGAAIRFEPPAPFVRGVHRITVAASGDGRVTAASMLLQTR